VFAFTLYVGITSVTPNRTLPSGPAALSAPLSPSLFFYQGGA
jgi:hypothetical protein